MVDDSSAKLAEIRIRSCSLPPKTIDRNGRIMTTLGKSSELSDGILRVTAIGRAGRPKGQIELSTSPEFTDRVTAMASSTKGA